MLEIVGGAVALLLVMGPVLALVGIGLLILAGLLPDASRRLRQTFHCPWRGRDVTADFLVTEGAEHPTDLAACSAFAEPTRITCAKRCREIAEVRWQPTRALFPRWALTAGGTTVGRDVEPSAGAR
jgi:hypothetical protein